MRQSASLALGLYGPSAPLPARPLQPVEAGHLATFLLAEAGEYFYSASVSLCDGLNGVGGGYYSWATVKLYYAAFYCVSALLARNGICMFHHNSKPRYLRARVGSLPAKANGKGTHQIAWNTFAQEFPHNVLLAPIDGRESYEWLRTLREQANYTNTAFWEPVVPPHFSWVDGAGVTRCVTAYVADTQFQYAFDKDHAAIAFPAECQKHTFQSLRSIAAGFAEDQRAFLAECRRHCSAQALAGLVLT
jgi:hypothetical protein